MEILVLKKQGFVVDKKTPFKAYRRQYCKKKKYIKLEISIIKTDRGYYKEIYDLWQSPYPPYRSCTIKSFDSCINLEINNLFLKLRHFHKENFLKACH